MNKVRPSKLKEKECKKKIVASKQKEEEEEEDKAEK